MTDTHPIRLACRAISKATGKPCGNKAIPGGRVCRYHGGRAPQTLEAARQRLESYVHPALDVYASYLRDTEAPEQIRFAVARDVLDRTGFKPTEKIQSDSEHVVHVVFDDMPITPPGRALSNGNGAHG